MALAQEAVFFHGNDQRRRDYTPAATAIVNGEVVNMGGLVGICTSPEGIAVGAKGSLATSDVFRMRKATGAGVTFAIGDPVGWDDVANTAVAAPGDFNAGVCVDQAAANGDEYVCVDINRAALN